LSPTRSCSPSTWSTSRSPSCKTSYCYSHNRTHISRRQSSRSSPCSTSRSNN
jgi:hypothetical protein